MAVCLSARAEAILVETGGRQLGCSFAARDHGVGGIVKGGHWWRHPGGDANSVVLLTGIVVSAHISLWCFEIGYLYVP